ncbi:MAG TPA: hypothetical protein VLI54_01485 [Bacillota bacterium]|nr:hypothetical protein [Bacillota bacterium]
MTLAQLETKLAALFDKKVPFALPPDARKELARSLWWVTLVVGVLQMLAAYSLWHAGHITDRFVDYANSISARYGGPVYVSMHLGMFYYLSLVVMAVVAFLLLIATPGLKGMRKSGWNLFFYATLAEALVAVVRLFSNVGGGFFYFVGAALSAVVGAFFLFQVRGQFTAEGVTTLPAAHHESPESESESSDAATDPVEPEEDAEPKKAEKKPKAVKKPKDEPEA